MNTLRLLVVEPDSCDPLGQLGHWWGQWDVELDVRRPVDDELPDSLEGYGAVVCLGGRMSVHDVAAHPWLADLQRLLASATAAGVPTLGVCLGAQLLAAGHGGSVGPADVPEVGPGLVSKQDAAWNDPLLADLPLLPDVVQFHADTIEALPTGADLLLSGAGHPYQAFRINGCAYGLQFHIESTTASVLQWAEQAPGLAASAREGALTEESLAQLHGDVEEVWHPVADNFVRLARGDVERAASRGRSLW